MLFFGSVNLKRLFLKHAKKFIVLVGASHVISIDGLEFVAH